MSFGFSGYTARASLCIPCLFFSCSAWNLSLSCRAVLDRPVEPASGLRRHTATHHTRGKTWDLVLCPRAFGIVILCVSNNFFVDAMHALVTFWLDSYMCPRFLPLWMTNRGLLLADILPREHYVFKFQPSCRQDTPFPLLQLNWS